MGELLLDTVLFLAQHRPEASPPPGPELITQAGNRFPRFDESALEQYFDTHQHTGATSEEGFFVFLPIVARHRLLPVLDLSYRLNDDWARLQVVMFVEKGVKDEPRAFGYRYDPPEGKPSGRHHFWHAQPMMNLRLHDGSKRKLPLKDHWRPPETPAFPLDADCAVDLIVCLMVSLYGFREAGRMQAESFGNRLGSRFARMRSAP